MSALERLLVGAVLLVALLIGAWLGVRHYGAGQYQAGQAAAIAAGRAQLERETAAARKIESDLRAQLREKDAAAFTKEKEYASNLEAAQRRMRAGTDRLRCPSALPGTAPAGGRPAAAGSGADGEGLAMVPEVAADILSLAADHQRLLRNYGRVVERFEACRAIIAQ